MTRQEYLEWCKGRALEYANVGELQNALVSISSDLNQHEETENHPGIALGLDLFMAGELSTPEQMRKFILGFQLHSGNLRSATRFCLKQREKYRPSFATRVRYLWWWLVSLATTKGYDLKPKLSDFEERTN